MRHARNVLCSREGCTLPEQTPTTAEEGQPGWAGAMAQIDAEIAELQDMLAKRREAARAEAAELVEAEENGPDSVA